MDFGLLPRGALELAAALSLAFNLSTQAPATDVNLTSPNLLSSYNIQTQDLQRLDVLEDNTGLEMVLTQVDELPVATVEPVYTVVQPTPKPTPEPEEEVDEEEGEIEIIKKAEAAESSPSPSTSSSLSASPSPSPTPASSAPSSASTTTDANGERMFQMVNDHRASKGLASFEKDGRLCEIAKNRAPQVKGELASGTLHKGFKDLNLPYWATENIAAYSTLEQNLKFWIADYIHRVAIESNHKYSCVACSGTSCSQIFTSFVSK